MYAYPSTWLRESMSRLWQVVADQPDSQLSVFTVLVVYVYLFVKAQVVFWLFDTTISSDSQNKVHALTIMVFSKAEGNSLAIRQVNSI